MTIYLDVVFIENICMNAIILYAVAIVTKTKAKTIRILLSSTLGSAYAVRDLHHKQLYLPKPNLKNPAINSNGLHSI